MAAAPEGGTTGQRARSKRVVNEEIVQDRAPDLNTGQSPRRSRAADTVHNLYYRHRCPVHGTAYASLFLHPSASVITQLGQSCSAATRLSLHIPPAHVAVDTAQ